MRLLASLSVSPIAASPCHQELLAVFENLTVLMQHHAVIGIGNDTGLRVHVSNGVVHPMQGNQR